MFCPNCGNNCGDANFCSHCGTKLKPNSADMGAAQNNQSNFKKTPVKQRFPAPPMKKLIFSGGDGFIELGEDYVRVRKFVPVVGLTDHTIPYKELYAVHYKAGRPFCQGLLCVRGWMERYRSPSLTLTEGVHDPGCAFVPHRSNEEYHKAYLFLKECAEIANAARNGEGQD